MEKITLKDLQREVSFKLKSRTDSINRIIEAIYNSEDETIVISYITKTTGIPKETVRYFLMSLVQLEYLTVEINDEEEKRARYFFYKTDKFDFGFNGKAKDLFQIILLENNIDIESSISDFLLINQFFTKDNFINIFSADKFYNLIDKGLIIKNNLRYSPSPVLQNLINLTNQSQFNKNHFNTALSVYTGLNGKPFTNTEKEVLSIAYCDLDGMDVFSSNIVSLFSNASIRAIQSGLSRLKAIGLVEFDYQERVYYKTHKMTDAYLNKFAGDFIELKAQKIEKVKKELFKIINMTLKRNSMVEHIIEKINSKNKVIFQDLIKQNEYSPEHYRLLLQEMTDKSLLKEVSKGVFETDYKLTEILF